MQVDRGFLRLAILNHLLHTFIHPKGLAVVDQKRSSESFLTEGSTSLIQME